ncbi:TPA: 1-acyl-sn-glycerol-3-phosphate acyltransferase [Candidatus Avigastranaerophilus faecigallinarum]|nr:1-acyl-sn-glycerol-3-phosphate acyltransferase [Candidatus Avigastranaerophilus faecigallinarum]
METKKKNYTKREVSDFTENKYKFQLFGRWLVPNTLMPIFYKIEYIGRENIPKDRNFIVAPNHISYFDPFIAGEAVRQPIAFMGKKELFENPILAFLLDGLACFAVNREKLEVSTIKTALNIFKTERWRLGIFPQGGIRRNRKIEKINKGFAVIAKQMKTDILPIGITGCEEYNWIPFKGKVRVVIGEPISFNQELEDIIDEWSCKVATLTNYEYIKEKLKSTENNEIEKSKV